MNIILFYPDELEKPLPLSDERAQHILNILKCREGALFYAGVVDGQMGQALLKTIGSTALHLEFRLDTTPAPLYPVGLIVGLSRPQTVKKILQDATSLGIASIAFTGTETGEKSYATSKLWTNAEYKPFVKLGAEQAFTTRLPSIIRYYSLKQCLAALFDKSDTNQYPRIAFDNYVTSVPVRSLPLPAAGCYIAIGSERGWTEKELALLSQYGFIFSHLGKRILRTETACVAAIVLILEKMQLI